MSPAPLLAMSDVLLGVIASGLTVHQIFKRFEPDSIPIHLALLFLPPTIFTYLLHPHISLLAALVASFGTYLTTLLLSIVIYRLSPWHPLARYPGPLYLKVSKLPLTWIASTGKQHKFVKKLHERYGDIVRTGPNEISIRNADAIPSVSTLPKGPRWINSKMAFSDQNSLIAEPNPHEHARRRKPWNRAFNSSALKGYEEIIIKRANMLYEGLAAQKGEVDLGKWIGYFSYDFMSDMAFGGGSEMLQNGGGGSNWHTLNDGMASFHVIGQIPWVVLYLRRIPSFARLIQRMVGQGVGLAIQRVKNGSLSRDLFYYLNNEDGAEPSAPPFRETVSNGTLAMIAGSDTTSIALSNLFYFVLSDPAVYARLRAEVDRYFPPGENPLDTKHHASMPFLNAVINETLRLIPVVPDGANGAYPRVPADALQAHSTYLPEGTITYVHFYSLHRDPKYFSPHPESFYPDRWLSPPSPPSSPSSPFSPSSPSPATPIHTPSAFVPFSFGPANCVGRGLALQEMRMLVCLLLQRFDMRFPERDAYDPRAYEAGLEDWFTIQKPALKVVLTPRQA